MADASSYGIAGKEHRYPDALTDQQIVEIEARARAATQEQVRRWNDGECKFEYVIGAEFVKVDPDTVLKLVAEVRRARG